MVNHLSQRTPTSCSSRRYAWRVAAVVLASLAFLITAATPAARAEPPMMGVNLAGGEFGSNVPGAYATDYIYPTQAEFDYYRARNLTLIRLPFRWERVQRTLNVALDATEMSRIDTVIGYARARDMKVILDMHNYNRYRLNGTTYDVGSAQVPHSALRDVWTRIAARYRTEPAIFGYDLMNEPQGTLANWQAAAQQAVDGIRTQDTSHWVIVEGVGWAGTQSWVSINGTLRVNDPINKLFYSAHSYWDRNHDGVYGSYSAEGGNPNMGVNYAKPFVDWIKANNFNGFIGEYGVPHNTDAAAWSTVLENFLAYCRDNGISGTYWAGGPWWGDGYALGCEPYPLTDPDKPQMPKLREYGQLLFEAESVAVSSASDSVTDISEPPLSGRHGEMLNANAVNDFISYTLPNVPAGMYSVLVGVKRHSSRGQFQLAIDSVNHGAAQDLYRSSQDYHVFDLGPKTFSAAGSRQFRFTVAGKHASSSGYGLLIDYICLRKGGEETIILDSSDTAGVTKTGTWTASTSIAGYHGSNYLHDNNGSKGSRSVLYTPTLASAGDYEVFARWTADPNRAGSVPITVTAASGPQTVNVDQRANNGVWISLGTYPFNAGATGNVLISNTATNGYVIADAVKWVKVSP